MTLYTIGYLGWKIDALEARLKSLASNLRIYDVRYRPYSRDRQFSQASFIEKFGNMYVHAKGFGNVDYKSGPIQLADPEPWYKFAKRDLEADIPVVLLCACWNLEECHRLVIAKELETRLCITAEHLTKKKSEAKERPIQAKLF